EHLQVKKYLNSFKPDDVQVFVVSWMDRDQWWTLFVLLTPPARFCIISTFPSPTDRQPAFPPSLISLVAFLLKKFSPGGDFALEPNLDMVPFEITSDEKQKLERQLDAVVSFLVGARPCSLKQQHEMRLRLVSLAIGIDLETIFPLAPLKPKSRPGPDYIRPVGWPENVDHNSESTVRELIIQQTHSLHQLFRQQVEISFGRL
ncbi:hypothetical protein JCM5350_005652, partial [Sporobolomyces pararoseus]